MKTISFFYACLAVLLLSFILSCGDKRKEVKEGTVFYFYPKANVYFDEDNNQYFIAEKEKGWQAVPDLPIAQKDTLGKKILLTNPSKPVWKNNAQDRLLYSLETHASPTDYQKKFYEDSINSLPKKIEKVPEDTASKKEKGGFGKFLKKIFSKKEKKEKAPEEN